jgi:hypothetical protein
MVLMVGVIKAVAIAPVVRLDLGFGRRFLILFRGRWIVLLGKRQSPAREERDVVFRT